MDPSTTTRTRAPARHRVLAAAGAGVLLFGALPAGVASAHGGGHVLRVGPGEQFTTIQAAVDRAVSGDTIRIAPGNYREAVCVEHEGLTIRGAGTGLTNIVWPDWETPADLPALTPDQQRRPCWAEQERVDGEDDPGTLADDVSALFFLDPDSEVRVSGLTTRNHPASGIVAWGARGFSVTGTSGYWHDRYGIIALDSTGVRITGNHEIGLDRGTDTTPNAGTAGISVGDSDHADARISGNHVEAYNLGIFLREARGGRVTGNALSGNCIGLLLFDDVATEVPDQTRDVPSGAFRITGNLSTDNDRYCLQGRMGDQHVSGVGMQVVNADDVTIAGNVIAGNTAELPASVPFLTNPAGGLTLISLPAFNAPPGASAGPVEDVRVSGNYFRDNVALVPVGGPPPTRSVQAPVDVFVGSPMVPPLLDAGEGLEFRGNHCDVSIPATICDPV
ncbi:Right handed beta helix region [Geodermatophilus amargosae]|uniref:Right handed beta helix region n=1 Tax=Geodermatophilus amargosae TaxID=1296565 RepID=A0A1I7BXY6_9ACTN|nr:right-handed parallel beta-helix repeat-containing protein [Geodermatophilus amargosae]SFT92021.1 Right handed beta helix region [Geodermatophilus amargosae]